MINFVVSDLETALVPNGEKMVQEETIELIMELKEKGVYFAVATGRNYDAVYPMFGKAKDHIVYICNDGGSVIYRDKVISKTPLDRLVCLEVANELEKNRDYKLLFSGERNAVVTTRDIDFINYLRTRLLFLRRKALTRLHMSISIRNSQRMQMWQFPPLNSYILQQSM